MPVIQLTTYLAAPPEQCFDAVLNVDVQVRLDSETHAVGAIKSGPLHAGDLVTWRAVHFGLPWRMSSRIVTVDRPRTFTDAMARGPFARWHHAHRFDPVPGGTAMHDHVEYAPPLGPLGRLFDAVVLERYLTGLLAARNQKLKEIVEGAQGVTGSTAAVDL